MTPLQISATALDVEWQRIQVIAANLANMNTTRSVNGALYQPMRLVSGPSSSFSTVIGGLREAQGVRVMSVEPTGAAPRLSFDASHPDADSSGFVAYPGVDHAGEMTMLVMASRVYEANLAAFGIAQQMAARSLEMGRSQ